MKRTINWETTLIAYDGWKPIVEWDEWGYFRAWNVYGPGSDEILWRYADRYGHLRYHLDRMGHVAFLLDLDGAVREKYTYDAFGRPTVSDWDDGNARSWSWYGNRFLFTGREWIPELGLYDYRNRFYHPLLGRFLQADPKGFDAGDMNLFRYVGDDPVDKGDPMGLAAVPHMGYYDQPLFPPEKIAVWSTFQPPPLGSLIPIRTTFELIKTGDRNIHVQRIRTEGRTGDLTERIGWTDARLALHDAVQEGGCNYRFTAEMKIDVYYADGAKQAAKDWAFPKEPQHAAAFDNWAATTAKRILGGLNSKTYNSPNDADRWFRGSGLQRTFNDTWNETHRQLDKPGYDLKTCPHCYPGEAF